MRWHRLQSVFLEWCQKPARQQGLCSIQGFAARTRPSLTVGLLTRGTQWQYSGEGIFLVQRVVEKTTGVPIAAYMKKNVLEPLGMTSSTYAWTPGVDRTFAQPALFHWGGGPGLKNFTWIQPERKTALVFFTNGDHGQSTYSFAFRQLLKEDPASLLWI